MSSRNLSHPFGRENEASIQQQFKVFCNHLNLGQWELARSCVKELHEQEGLLGISISDVLLGIARNPYDTCVGTKTIQSPHHLSWLCFKEVSNLEGIEEKISFALVQKNIEFRLLLFESDSDITQDVLQELYQRFCEITTPGSPAPVSDLSAKSVEFISYLLLTKPRLGHAIITSLLLEEPTASCNVALLDIYIRCLSIILQQLASVFSRTSKSAEGDGRLDDVPEDAGDLERRFYMVLALFDPSPAQCKALNTQRLMEKVVRSVHVAGPDSGSLRWDALCSCLLGRDSAVLLQQLYEADWKWKEREYVTHSEAQITNGGTMLKLEKCLIGLTSAKSGRNVWKDLYFLSLKHDRHVMDMIIETAIHLIQDQDIKSLSLLLTPEEFQPLKPLVILLGWDHVVDTATAKRLLEALWNPKDASILPRLSDACGRLRYQVQLTEWCLEQVRTFAGCDVISEKAHLKTFFHGLEVHSALYLLHHCTRLSNLHAQEVFTFLRNSPASGTNGDAVQTRMSKTVKFALDQKDPTVTTPQPIRIEQEVDVSLYRGFQIIRAIMDVITFAATHASPRAHSSPLDGVQDHEGFGHATNLVKFDIADTCGNNSEGVSAVASQTEYARKYDEHVVRRLKEVKSQVRELYPLQYRLEILEDVFSLLFVRRQDVSAEHDPEAWDSDDGAEMERFSLDYLRSPSPDGLSEPPCDPHVKLSGPDKVARGGSKNPPASGKMVSVDVEKCSENGTATSVQNGDDVKATLGDTSDTSFKARDVGDTGSGVEPTDDLRREKRSDSFLLSATSLASSGTLHRTGFLADDLVVRDILLTLKDSLAELNASVASLGGDESSRASLRQELDARLSDRLLCSVDRSQVTSRLGRLGQHVSEALWRFQLVADDWMPREFGKLADLEAVTKCRNVASDDENDACAGLFDLEEGYCLPRARNTLSEGSSASAEADSHVTAATTDGSQSGASSSSVRGRHRRRRSKQKGGKERSLLLKVNDCRSSHGFVNKMLADKDTLLCMCLRDGRFTHAQQVVKICTMEDAPLAREATFAEEFLSTVKQLQAQGVSRAVSSASSSKRAKPGPTSLALGRASLSSIAKMAAAGLSSLSVTGVVDQILGLARLPVLTGDSSDSIGNTKTLFSVFLHPDNVASMIVLDLACVACPSMETSDTILTMAQKRLPPTLQAGVATVVSALATEAQKMARIENASSARVTLYKPNGCFGVSDFLHRLSGLLSVGKSAYDETRLKMVSQRSAHDLLTSSLWPLSTVKQLKAVLDARVEIEKELKKTERAVVDCRICPAKSLWVANRGHGGSFRKLSRSLSGSGDKPLVRIAMKTLLATLRAHIPPGGEAAMLLGNVANADPDKLYLECLYGHARALFSLLDKWQCVDLDCREYFSVLNMSPTRIMGQLMFEASVPPDRLEEVAQTLSINLVQTIVGNCCPGIPTSPRGMESADTLTAAGEEHKGRIVLNGEDHVTVMATVKKPEVFVRTLLTRLLRVIKDNSEAGHHSARDTESCLHDVIASGAHRPILRQLQRLVNVDLGAMTSNQERLCFFVNLANIMSIHLWLYALENNTNQHASLRDWREVIMSASTRTPSQLKLDRLLSWDRCMYRIGQLGLVSYFDLRYVICHRGLAVPSSMEGLLRARWHDLDLDDPWNDLGCQGEPGVAFVISDGFISSPPVQVLSPDLMKTQLHVATCSYLNASVTAENNVVTIPELLDSHKGGFVTVIQGNPEQKTDATSDEVKVDDEGHRALLEVVAEMVENPLRSFLRQLLGDADAAVKVKVAPSAYAGPVYYPDFDRWRDVNGAAMRHLPARRRSCSETELAVMAIHSREDLEIWKGTDGFNDRGGGGSCYGNGKMPPYLLTSEVLDYLKGQSDLVATLASTVCRDNADLIQTQLAEDHFLASTPPPELENARTQGLLREESRQSDIKAYRRERLVEYYPGLLRSLERQSAPFVRSQARENPDPRADDSTAADDLDRIFTPLDTFHRRACAWQHPCGPGYLAEVHGVLAEVVVAGEWPAVVGVLQALPSETRCLPEVTLRANFALRCAVSAPDAVDHVLASSYIPLISCPDTRRRLTLAMIRNLSAKEAIRILTACLQRDEDSLEPSSGAEMDRDTGSLARLVRRRLREMTVYQKIIDCAAATLARLTLDREAQDVRSGHLSDRDVQSLEGITMETEDWTRDLLLQMTQWVSLVEVSRKSPDSVLEVLLQCKEFDTARAWAEIFSVSDKLKQSIVEGHVAFILEEGTPDTTTAFQMLESVKAKSSEACFEVCCHLLERLENKANLLFVAEFTLRELEGDLGERRAKELRTLCLGCKALLCLGRQVAADYEHLVEAPLILLEQLLMNMKIDLAGRVLALYRHELGSGTRTAGHVDMTSSDCDQLLVQYATMALEFSIVEADLAVSPGRQSRASMTSQSGEMPPPRTHRRVQTMTSFSTALQSPMSRSRSSLALAARGGAGLLVGSLPTAAASSLGQKAAKPADAGAGLQSRGPFVMPPEPPAKDQWVPDTAASVCMSCQLERFSMFNRRHHCRRCGRLVCSTCSARTTQIGGKSARTCDDCYQQIFTPRATLKEREKLQLLRERLSGVSAASGASPWPGSAGLQIAIGSTSPGRGSPDVNQPMAGDYSDACAVIMSMDDQYNALTREEFYYDHAPSTSLCLSLLELHSDLCRCAEVLLDLCDQVSRHLQPIAPGIRNPEVDYGLVISMLKYLLFNAKVKFLKGGRLSGVERCDMYLDRVSLLDLLVSQNCSYIPSVQQLTQLDTLRRLRDRLIEEEKLTVAMEMSTKCGLDPSGVWTAWGIACIQSGDYVGAREKFAKCLKEPLDRSQTLSQTTSKILTDIVDALENSLAPSGGDTISLLSPLGSVKDLLADPGQRPEEELPLEDARLQECLYYLNKYGCYTYTVNFYRRRGQLRRAALFILENGCGPDVFVEGLLVPSLPQGSLGPLQEQLVALDPSLQAWTPHLTAACRYLDKCRLVNTLYHFQLFIKDYIRAAMTCVAYFYQRGARDYRDLYGRLASLKRAKAHMEAYLGERPWLPAQTATPHGHPTSTHGAASSLGGKGRGPGGAAQGRARPAKAEQPLRKVMTPAEVTKYLRALELQLEVTKYLYQYHDNYDVIVSGQSQLTSSSRERRLSGTAGARASTAAVAPSSEGPPTLFGSSSMKSRVASLVLLCGNRVHDGYGTAFRIIQHFKLDSREIYRDVAAHLARCRRYPAIRQLLDCLRESGVSSDDVMDLVLAGCVECIADEPSEAKEADMMIKMIKDETRKIEALIRCRKLKSAYLLAVRSDRVDDVLRIRQTADSLGQEAVVRLCQQWLQKRQTQR